MENYATTEEVVGFVVDNDTKANWALKKIKQATAERDRLMKLVEGERYELLQREQEINASYENATAYFTSQLQQYMATRDADSVKQTKTQATYELLSGKLVQKKNTTEYERDNDKLVDWLSDNNHTNFVKVKKDVDWASLKKHLIICDDGTVVTEDGELVEGVTAVEQPGKFEIKFK